jgi:hypothetical protein
MRQCRICGCTDEVPCLVYDDHGFDRPCWWFESDLCSVCAGLDDVDVLTTGGLPWGNSASSPRRS